MEYKYTSTKTIAFIIIHNPFPSKRNHVVLFRLKFKVRGVFVVGNIVRDKFLLVQCRHLSSLRNSKSKAVKAFDGFRQACLVAKIVSPVKV